MLKATPFVVIADIESYTVCIPSIYTKGRRFIQATNIQPTTRALKHECLNQHHPDCAGVPKGGKKKVCYPRQSK
jgi:hypothetical protein